MKSLRHVDSQTFYRALGKINCQQAAHGTGNLQAHEFMSGGILVGKKIAFGDNPQVVSYMVTPELLS